MENENKIALSQITKATTELRKASTAQEKAEASLREVLAQVGPVSEEIQVLEIKKSMLAEQLKNSARQHEVDLDLQVKENEQEVLEKILDKRSLVTINPDEREELRETADRANREFEEDIQKAVTEALDKKEINYMLEKAAEDQEVAVQRAENQSEISSLTSQLEAAKQVNIDLREQLSAEREAGVKRAEAAGAMTINAGSK